MGVLRILLAIAVMYWHSSFIISGFNLIQGSLAVEVFFIISGYYMAMILTTKYKNALKAFYLNRIIKIYSIYFLVLFACFFVETVHVLHHHVSYFDWRGFPLEAKIWIVFSNIFILGLDMQMFFSVVNGHIVFLPFTLAPAQPFFRSIFISQAWSISLELYFYMLIPFLINRKKIFYGLLVGSLLLKIFLYEKGLDYDPWTDRFFPAELWLFFLGVLSYQFDKYLKKIPVVFAVVYIIILMMAPHVFYNTLLYYIFVYVLTFCCIPVLFKLTLKSKLDRLIGETSYAFYLIHMLVIEVIPVKIHSIMTLLFVVFCTFLIALLIEKVFYTKVQKIRKMILNRNGIKSS